MTKQQWNLLCDIVDGRHSGPPATAFIIDSPWIPGWYGVSHLEYYHSEKTWFEANKKAINSFPETIFLPGFWSEYGMCTEPSAFGAKCIWKENQLPHADRLISDVNQVNDLRVPDPSTDGLLPFMIERMRSAESLVNEMGHEYKFAVARGPLNIASFLMGSSEFMMALMLQPDETHRLLEKISTFTVAWIRRQKEIFPGIDGILLLDDIVGFIGEAEVQAFAVPYIKQIFNAFDAKIRFFHNDASGLVSTPFLGEIGVNLYNFSFEHSINEIRNLAGNEVALLGNLPPRDVLAAKSPEEVEAATIAMFEEVKDKSRILWSCGGGMPQDVSTANIKAFLRAIKNSV